MKLTCIITLAAITAPAFADSTIDSVNKYALGANLGWINFRHDQPAPAAGAITGEYVLAGQIHGANVGWIDLGDGTPANGIQYQNNSATDYGVNHDAAGQLSGYAYGANIGWINFGWSAATDPNRARIDLLTGSFAGFAWGANVGWINLGAGFLNTDAIRSTDTDADGLGDAWERIHFGNLTKVNSTGDFDSDGSSNLAEYTNGTLPNNPASVFEITVQKYNASYTQGTITFTSSPARVYRLEVSTDLRTWGDSGPGLFAADPGATTTRLITLPGARRIFLRALAFKPLQP